MTETIFTISDQQELNQIIEREKAILLYVSSPGCSICKSLKPRINKLVKDEFPELIMYNIDAIRNPGIAGQLSVFSFPTLIVYIDKKEFMRKVRSFGLEEIRNDISRLYSLRFD